MRSPWQLSVPKSLHHLRTSITRQSHPIKHWMATNKLYYLYTIHPFQMQQNVPSFIPHEQWSYSTNCSQLEGNNLLENWGIDKAFNIFLKSKLKIYAAFYKSLTWQNPTWKLISYCESTQKKNQSKLWRNGWPKIPNTWYQFVFAIKKFTQFLFPDIYFAILFTDIINQPQDSAPKARMYINQFSSWLSRNMFSWCKINVILFQ